MCDIKLLRIKKKCATPLEPEILTIEFGNDQVGLCSKCWNKICDTNFEWGKTPRPTMEQILSEETRGLVGAIKTEYKERGLTNSLESGEEENE